MYTVKSENGPKNVIYYNYVNNRLIYSLQPNPIMIHIMPDVVDEWYQKSDSGVEGDVSPSTYLTLSEPMP